MTILGPKEKFKDTKFWVEFCSEEWASPEHFKFFDEKKKRGREELLLEDKHQLVLTLVHLCSKVKITKSTYKMIETLYNSSSIIEAADKISSDVGFAISFIKNLRMYNPPYFSSQYSKYFAKCIDNRVVNLAYKHLTNEHPVNHHDERVKRLHILFL